MSAPTSHFHNSGGTTDLRDPSFGRSHPEIKSSMKPVFLNPSGFRISAFAQNISLHRPAEELQILINLHRNISMDIETNLVDQPRKTLKSVFSMHFGDKGRDPSHYHNNENYCYSPIKTTHHTKPHLTLRQNNS